MDTRGVDALFGFEEKVPKYRGLVLYIDNCESSPPGFATRDCCGVWVLNRGSGLNLWEGIGSKRGRVGGVVLLCGCEECYFGCDWMPGLDLRYAVCL